MELRTRLRFGNLGRGNLGTRDRPGGADAIIAAYDSIWSYFPAKLFAPLVAGVPDAQPNTARPRNPAPGLFDKYQVVQGTSMLYLWLFTFTLIALGLLMHLRFIDRLKAQ